MSKTYSNLYPQIVREIEKRGGKLPTTTDSRYAVQPAGVGGSIDARALAEIITTVVSDLAELIEPRILSGLDVTATTPPSGSVTVSSGIGTSDGKKWELSDDITLQIPFDSSTYVFYIILDNNALEITRAHEDSKCEICKIIVPKPGTTVHIVDDKPDDGYDAWIVSAKDVVYDEDQEFDDTSIEKLRDVIGRTLADNLIGNIRLSENLKILNTQGSLEIDSSSVKILSVAGTTLAKFNRNGTFFYDDDGVELAKFSTDGARVGNIVVTTSSIQSGNFASGTLGSGFQILDNGDAEFNNILARGKLTTSVFEKSTISAVGGNLLVMDADVLDEDMTALDSSTLTIIGDTTFDVNDILRIKDGTSDEWLQVSTRSGNIYTTTRDKAGTYTTDNNPTWKKGTAVVNYGQSEEGGIYLTSSESNSPYISVVTHSGSPWSTTSVPLRIGNLNGFLGYLTDLYGIAIGESTKYLKYDATNGLRVAGHTLLGSLSLSTGGYINSGQTAYNTGVGYWLEYNNGTPRISIGNPAGNNLTWDGTNLNVTGSITVTGGSWSHASDTTKIDGGDIYTDSITADSINVAQLSAITADLGTITAGTVTGATVQTATSGARVLMNTSNLVAYDDAAAEVFKVLISGADVGDVIFGNAAVAYMKWDKSAGTLLVADVQSPDYSSGTAGYKLSSSTGLEVNEGVIKGSILSGDLDRNQVFTSSGTFTAPTGVTEVFVTLIAGGGGGGGRDAPDTHGAGGGGGGGSTANYQYTVIPGNDYTVTIGAGGTGGTNANGNDGSASLFGTLPVSGGKGGLKGAAGAGGVGGKGGGQGTDATSDTGGTGAAGISSSGGNGATGAKGGGAGGGSVGGTGGSGGSGNGDNGDNGTGYGSGGGGGSGGGDSTTTTGGNGAAGYCLVIW